jgi:hypothetical protein
LYTVLNKLLVSQNLYDLVDTIEGPLVQLLPLSNTSSQTVPFWVVLIQTLTGKCTFEYFD